MQSHSRSADLVSSIISRPNIIQLLGSASYSALIVSGLMFDDNPDNPDNLIERQTS